MSYTGTGMGVSPPNGQPLTQLDCMQQGRFYIDGQCLTMQEYTAKLCVEQVGGVFNATTGECEMKAATGMSEVAAKMACESVGGVWNDQTKACAWPTPPVVPPTTQPPVEPPPPPPEKAAVPWGTIGAIGLGLSLVYVFARGK